LLSDGDDGLLPRFLWVWPEPVGFRLGHQPPRTGWAIRALDRLRELDLQRGDPPLPIRVRLAAEACSVLENFARDMQQRQPEARAQLAAALGKARGQALRLALVLELLWWCGEEDVAPPPGRISQRAMAAATEMIQQYFIPVAARVYGRSEPIARDRNAAVLARWILDAQPEDVHLRYLQRQIRLPGLRNAAEIEAAAEMLVAAGWLARPVPTGRFGPRSRRAYRVNPRLKSLSAGCADQSAARLADRFCPDLSTGSRPFA
jgi:hypothetical protein